MLRKALTAALALLAAATADVIVYKEESPELITIEQEFRDLPASFGPVLPDDGLRGRLVVGEPENGCGVMPAPPTTNYTDKWILLVARYNCSFETKVRNAMAAGYDCVIVHNINSKDLETMSAKDPEGINIFSVFVDSDAGDLLRTYTYKDGPYHIMVNGDLPFNINTHLLLPFAGVVALCLIVIIIFTRSISTTYFVTMMSILLLPVVLIVAVILVIFMIVKCIKDRRRARRHRLPNRSLRKIPTCKFSKGDPYDTCAICLDDYQEGERLRVLPCAHAYHAKCIDPWLTQNRRVCPVCKRKVLAAGERDTRTRSSSASESDSDAPLLDSAQQTQGGTFAEQPRVNPFVRAARLRMFERLRARPRPRDEEAGTPEENDESTNENNEATVSDTASLLPAGRRARRQRRAERQRQRAADHAHAHDHTHDHTHDHAGDAHQPAPAPAPDAHSINTDAEARGEIGVAALPALPQTSASLERQPSVEYR